MVCFFPTLGEDNLGLDPDAVKWLIWHSTVYFSVHVFINIWFSALLFTNIRVPSLQENDTFLACGLISDVTMWLASANKMLSRHAVWHWQAEAEDQSILCCSLFFLCHCDRHVLAASLFLQCGCITSWTEGDHYAQTPLSTSCGRGLWVRTTNLRVIGHWRL